MSRRVVIVGGGISGLSCAHDLVKNGFQVTILERSSVMGGQSRSEIHQKCHTCYSWRVFTTQYKNLLRIFSEIPHPRGGSVLNQMTVTKSYRSLGPGANKLSIGFISLGDVDSSIPADEIASMKNKIITLACMCEQRLKSFDDVTFFDFMAPKSRGSIAFIDHVVAPFLGLEARRASVHAVVFMLQSVYGDNAKGMVPNAPYDEAIFTPWKEHLTRMGVNILTDAKIFLIFSCCQV